MLREHAFRRGFIERHSRSKSARAGVQNRVRVKKLLNAAVLSVLAVKRVKNNINLRERAVRLVWYSVKVPRASAVNKDINSRVLLRQMSQNGRSTFERDLIFAGRSPAQHANTRFFVVRHASYYSAFEKRKGQRDYKGSTTPN
jgi:hypothetical protein